MKKRSQLHNNDELVPQKILTAKPRCGTQKLLEKIRAAKDEEKLSVKLDRYDEWMKKSNFFKIMRIARKKKM